MTRRSNLARSSKPLDLPSPPQAPLSAATSPLAASKKTRMISAPMAKKLQATQMPFQPPQSPVFEFLEPSGTSRARELARRSSWESDRSRRSSEKGPQESQVSVVVSEADDSNEVRGYTGRSDSRADRTTVSVYTDESVKDLERPEGGVLRVWFSQFTGTSQNASQESIPSPSNSPATPEITSLSLPASLPTSPASQDPSTPPLDSHLEPPTPSSSRSRSKSSSASTFPFRYSASSDYTHIATCGGLGLLFPRSSLSRRSSSPNLRPPSSSSSEFSDFRDDDWEHFPPSSSIPDRRSGLNAQRYAYPIEEESFLKKVVWTRPEVKARPRYKGLREVPSIPVKVAETGRESTGNPVQA
ncbi:hypothetical protein JCM3765_000707 [Sporobolomyces pararoseus]